MATPPAPGLNVGATNAKDDNKLPADFSNYGKTKVDVFAPGTNIYSTTPGKPPRISWWYQHGHTCRCRPRRPHHGITIPHSPPSKIKEIIMKSVTKRDILKD